jgi:hypothetical protein
LWKRLDKFYDSSWPAATDAFGLLIGEFLKWLDEPEACLSIPVREEPYIGERIGLVFQGINAEIDGFVTCRELTVSVNREGQDWETLLSLDIDARRRRRGGFICSICDPKDRIVFPTLGALWRDHLFEPFLVWVNQELAVAEEIGLYGSLSDGYTYAKRLSRNDHEGIVATARPPIRAQSE